jgi:hypothetical protein
LLDVVGWAYGWLREAGERSGNKSISFEIGKSLTSSELLKFKEEFLG